MNSNGSKFGSMGETFQLRLDGPILQALLDLLPGTLHVKDRALRYCIVNRKYLERWGASAEQVIGRTTEEAFGNLFGGEADERNRAVFASGKALPFYEVTYPDSHGGSVILWATKVPLLDAHGSVTHVLTFSLDITPLKLAQQRLSESEQLRSAIVEQSLECFITCDADGCIVEFNPAAEQVFGYTRAGALGKPIGDLLQPTQINSDAEISSAWQRSRALLDRSGQRFETLGSRADAKTIPVEISLVEIPLRERRLFTACVRDLSKQQSTQVELEHQRQALYQSERLSVLGTLAAGISHELRNPLSVVLSQAKLLEGELTADRSQLRLSAIGRAAERCAAIVSAFLEQSKSTPGKFEHFELNRVIESALDLSAHVLREQDISLHVERAAPDISVQGNWHQLSQVVLNLLLNASAAMEYNQRPRRIVICTQLCKAENAVELSVSDSGPGIAPELRERVFERFFTTKAAQAGTGLGLAICRDIVSAHGGRITAEQSDDGGAMFRVRLPVSCRDQNDEPDSAQAARPEMRYRVLIVDDEAEIADLLREILELAGHEVDVANSGESALQRVADVYYDLVLSDMRMPGMDGPMLYDTLCMRVPDLSKRLAFITGDTLSPSAAEFLQRTGISHLAKPFEPRQVTELVARLGAAKPSHGINPRISAEPGR